MDKTYTFKHVIFGLREEYLKIEKELNELKNMLMQAMKFQIIILVYQVVCITIRVLCN